MQCIVHRGTSEIGGSCVELRSQGKGLVLDIGTPLVNADRSRFDAGKLDRALERRIALKVEFPRPDRVMRRVIWEKLLPAKMPLAEDVSLDRLAECDLTGGEIKNAVLNAARHALNRNGHGPVAMEDLLAAAELETEGRWSADGGGKVGF